MSAPISHLPSLRRLRSMLAEGDTAAASAGTTIRLPSRVDVHVVDDLYRRLHAELDAGTGALVLDASEVKHLDAAGIRFVESAHDRVVAKDVVFELISSTTLRVALELTGSKLHDAVDRASVFGLAVNDDNGNLDDEVAA